MLFESPNVPIACEIIVLIHEFECIFIFQVPSLIPFFSVQSVSADQFFRSVLFTISFRLSLAISFSRCAVTQLLLTALNTNTNPNNTHGCCSKDVFFSLGNLNVWHVLQLSSRPTNEIMRHCTRERDNRDQRTWQFNVSNWTDKAKVNKSMRCNGLRCRCWELGGAIYFNAMSNFRQFHSIQSVAHKCFSVTICARCCLTIFRL